MDHMPENIEMEKQKKIEVWRSMKMLKKIILFFHPVEMKHFFGFSMMNKHILGEKKNWKKIPHITFKWTLNSYTYVPRFNKSN